MLHIMLDMYGADGAKLNDMRGIYETIFKILNQMSVKLVSPPVIVPYYYGKVKDDDGISAFVILKGGHFTIHTFPERGCYFADLLYDGFISEDKLIDVLSRELPFDHKIVNIVDRRFDLSEQCKFNTIDEYMDFGPHYLIRTIEKKDFSIDNIYHFLDELPTRINMDPIMRPYVITDKISDFSIISGITVIAQSHIAMHYFMRTQIAYLDVFSCSFINCDNIFKIIENKLNVKCENILISRGSKHVSKLVPRSEVIERYNSWKKIIKE